MKQKKEIILKVGSYNYQISWLFSRNIRVIVTFVILSWFWIAFFKNELLTLLENKQYEQIILIKPALKDPVPNNHLKIFFFIHGYEVLCGYTKNKDGIGFCDITYKLKDIKSIEKVEAILMYYPSEVKKRDVPKKGNILINKITYIDNTNTSHEFIVSPHSMLKTDNYFNNGKLLLYYFFLSSYIGLILYSIQDWIKCQYLFFLNFLKRK